MESALNRFALSFQRNWLLVLVAILLLYSGLPILGPVLKSMGFERAAQVFYQPYKAVCHTYGFRSFYLFGEKIAYSRAEFDQRSGIDTASVQGLFDARDFQGNAAMGYKIGICQRDMAIYPAMALGGIVFSLMRRRMTMMPWWLFLLIGIGPIGLDGFSQLLSQPPFNNLALFQLIPYRESVWQLRVITGALFGFSVAWLIFPLIAGSLADPEPQPAGSRRS